MDLTIFTSSDQNIVDVDQSHDQSGLETTTIYSPNFPLCYNPQTPSLLMTTEQRVHPGLIAPEPFFLANNWRLYQHPNISNPTVSIVIPSAEYNTLELRKAQKSQRRIRIAPRMTAKDWQPYEDRLRQLLRKRIDIKELRECMNKEIGRTLTERQYKAKIQDLRCGKNAKQAERKAIVKMINYREKIGKSSTCVRIRGHEKNEETLTRWRSEFGEISDAFICPPSPLPTCVSVCTGTSLQTILEGQDLANQNLQPSDTTENVLRRLLKFSRTNQQTIKTLEARSMFNDIQRVLALAPENANYEYSPGTEWSRSFEQDIIQIRNYINLSPKLVMDNNLKENVEVTSRRQGVGPKRTPRWQHHRYAVWNTPYGKICASFWNTPSSTVIADQSNGSIVNDSLVARLAIITRTRFLVALDLDPRYGPYAKLSYHPLVLSTSRIFDIVRSGTVRQLQEYLASGDASLNDRDEQGRSLLNYSLHAANLDVSRFLITTGADVNSIEPMICDPSYSGSLLSVTHTLSGGLKRTLDVTKLCLEAGADPTLRFSWMNESGGQMVILSDVMTCVIRHGTLEELRMILNLGEALVGPWNKIKFLCGNIQPPLYLLQLAAGVGMRWFGNREVLEKALLLIQRGFSISYRGFTLLQIVVRSARFHEIPSIPGIQLCRGAHGQCWKLSLIKPIALMILFIAAGVNVYSASYEGETASSLAAKIDAHVGSSNCLCKRSWRGRLQEWTRALEYCGFDADEVIAASDRGVTEGLQKSRLNPEDYVRRFETGLLLEDLKKDLDDNIDGAIGISDDETNASDDSDESNDDTNLDYEYHEDDFGGTATPPRQEPNPEQLPSIMGTFTAETPVIQLPEADQPNTSTGFELQVPEEFSGIDDLYVLESEANVNNGFDPDGFELDNPLFQLSWTDQPNTSMSFDPQQPQDNFLGADAMEVFESQAEDDGGFVFEDMDLDTWETLW